jgi:hypothetical protein
LKIRPFEIVNAYQLFVGNQPSVGGHLEDMDYPMNWRYSQPSLVHTDEARLSKTLDSCFGISWGIIRVHNKMTSHQLEYYVIWKLQVSTHTSQQLYLCSKWSKRLWPWQSTSMLKLDLVEWYNVQEIALLTGKKCWIISTSWHLTADTSLFSWTWKQWGGEKAWLVAIGFFTQTQTLFECYKFSSSVSNKIPIQYYGQ